MSSGTPVIKRWDKEILQYVLIVCLGGLFQQMFFEGDIFNGRFDLKDILTTGFYWLFLWKGSEYQVIYLNRLGIEWDHQPVKRLLLALSISIVYVMIVTVSIYMVAHVIFGNYTASELWSRFGWATFVIPITVTVFINAVMHGRAFLLQWKETAVEVEKLKNENLKSQYESLKNQVNPHFLFNSLNVLSELVYEDQSKAVKFIHKMSQVYRYVLETKDQELVSVNDELAFLENYAFLQQIRFGDNLRLEMELDHREGMVPPLAMQLLLENAIKHNVVSDAKPLTVRVSVHNQSVIVSNTIQEKLTKDSTGIGLENLKNRYQYLTDKQVNISKNKNEFKVVLPILKIQK